QPVLRKATVVRLQELLQGGLVIVADNATRAHLRDERPQFANEERSGLLDAAVEVNCGNERFIAIGQQRLLAAPSAPLLAAAQEQVIAEPESLREARQRR